MPTKIRLQRKGKKGQPFYHIVIADGRAPRDGRFIEKIGVYNPLTRPAEIDIQFDKALDWLQKGAQPTDTVRAILSYKGIMFKFHLLKGVQKGALTTEQAEVKFQAWLTEKEEKIRGKKKEYELSAKEAGKQQKDLETKVNEAKAQALVKKLAKAQAAAADAAAVAAEPAVVEAAAETPAAEAVETPVAEAPETLVAEAPETPAAETPEAPAAEEAATPEEPKQE